MNESMRLQSIPLQQREELVAWSNHWSETNQQSVAQQFFSFYRKAVFARGVSYFADRYFPAQGILVEAGSGTAETSMRIGKNGGQRKLVALDIVLPVLERVHPVMDVRMCADIFQLPFQDGSLDGLWNVGVMEHFTHEQIDRILQEFHRVLKEDHNIILLWPGTDSVPQRMLRVVEWIVNRRKRGARFRFHPEEISQIRSARQARDVLSRNGFQVLEIEPGFRTLFGFKTLVGKKPRTSRVRSGEREEVSK